MKDVIVLSRNSILSILTIIGCWTTIQPIHPVYGQALLPHALNLDSAKLEQQGLGLAQEASQLAQFQQYELALQRARLAAQLSPKNADVWSLLGGLYLQTNEVDNGITALQTAKSLDGKNSAVLFALGSAYFQKGKYTQAVEYITAGLQVKPNVPGALFDLGNAYLMLGKYSDAIKQYETAVAQDKAFWPAINNIGLIKYESGDVNEAIRRWEMAANMDAKAAEPRLAIAVALYSRGERDKGLSLADAALRLDSRYADVEFLKENLWGDRLLKDTKRLIETPKIRAVLVQIQESASKIQRPSPRE